MIKTLRYQVLLAAAVTLAGAVSFAQSPGEATYKAKCQNCHGAAGMAETTLGKALKVKPVTDPAVKKFTFPEMIAATRDGMGKMQPFKGKLTEAQIKDAVTYFSKFIN